MTSFKAIHSELVGDDPLLANSLVHPDEVADEGPTALLHEESPDGLQVGVEAIREGHLLHWGEGRLVKTEDSDLALLAGDRLYALGLERVAATGNEASIRALSRLIKESAAAMAAKSEVASEDVWTATCAKIGAPES